jgi:hypothetical protein
MAGAKVFAPITTKNETLIIAIPWPEFHINSFDLGLGKL